MMGKKAIKYLVLIVVIGLLGYNSVYFKKLDAPKTEVDNNETTPQEFAKLFWNGKFNKAIDSVITLEAFEKEFVEKGGQVTIEKYSHSEGVNSLGYMLQKFNGRVKEVSEDKIVLSIANSRTDHIDCNVGNYFGNGVRDATGLIKMGDFANSMDYNQISSELNKIVKTDVILPIKNKIRINDSLTVVGCVEIKDGRLQEEIFPVRIAINK